MVDTLNFELESENIAKFTKDNSAPIPSLKIRKYRKVPVRSLTVRIPICYCHFSDFIDFHQVNLPPSAKFFFFMRACPVGCKVLAEVSIIGMTCCERTPDRVIGGTLCSISSWSYVGSKTNDIWNLKKETYLYLNV